MLRDTTICEDDLVKQALKQVQEMRWTPDPPLYVEAAEEDLRYEPPED
jgi:hypothetical protein